MVLKILKNEGSYNTVYHETTESICEGLTDEAFYWVSHEKQKAMYKPDLYPNYMRWLEVNKMNDTDMNFRLYVYIAYQRLDKDTIMINYNM